MILELVINGLVQGCLLALICVGYSIAYGSAKVLNFAHADVMVIGGGYLVLLWSGGQPISPLQAGVMAGLFGVGVLFAGELMLPGRPVIRRALAVALGVLAAGATWLLAGRLPFFIAVLLAVPFTGALAAAVYRVGYLPLLRRGAPRTSILVVALGFSIALESIMLIAWGSERRVFPLITLPEALVVRPAPAGIEASASATHYGLLPVGANVWIPVHDVLIVAVFSLVVIGLTSFFLFTRTADAIIATADARKAARACGIPVERTLGKAFFLGGMVAAFAGTLYVLRSKSLDPMAGFTPGILAFAACVLGGIGSLPGSIAGAFVVSLVMALAPAVPLENFAASHLPAAWIEWLPSLNLGDWSYGVVYILMIIIILIKPKGLFAR